MGGCLATTAAAAWCPVGPFCSLVAGVARRPGLLPFEHVEQSRLFWEPLASARRGRGGPWRCGMRRLIDRWTGIDVGPALLVVTTAKGDRRQREVGARSSSSDASYPPNDRGIKDEPRGPQDISGLFGDFAARTEHRSNRPIPQTYV
jgi:hypothetical protein